MGDLRIVVFDRRRHIAGDHFTGIVVHRQQGDTLGAQVAIELPVLDHRQRMGDKCHLQAVLGDVLGTYIAHQRPAVNQFQT
ncbi:hypothetical protein D3C76_1678970 [compost metagenome]